MAKSKMKFEREQVDAWASVYFKKKESLWTAEVNLRVYINSKGEPSIEDADVEFEIDNKQVIYSGFKEFYDGLFGKGKYHDYISKLIDEAEVLYKAQSPEYQLAAIKKTQS